MKRDTRKEQSILEMLEKAGDRSVDIKIDLGNNTFEFVTRGKPMDLKVCKAITTADLQFYLKHFYDDNYITAYKEYNGFVGAKLTQIGYDHLEKIRETAARNSTSSKLYRMGAWLVAKFFDNVSNVIKGVLVIVIAAIVLHYLGYVQLPKFGVTK